MRDQKIINVNILALNRVYFPNYCLIIKCSIPLKVGSIGFCQFAAVKKNKSKRKTKCSYSFKYSHKQSGKIFKNEAAEPYLEPVKYL